MFDTVSDVWLFCLHIDDSYFSFVYLFICCDVLWGKLPDDYGGINDSIFLHFSGISVWLDMAGIVFFPVLVPGNDQEAGIEKMTVLFKLHIVIIPKLGVGGMSQSANIWNVAIKYI